ncbi:uncharacterized protein LOC131291246 [Anopheles ziemanni]|uniref:uncharacterized protein LOC131269057 n=1 Tax=Anopheles coustani TaxID=139045 RepID=UPI00265A5B09|nr:uncharacterized protein LOC131269057 [Anopheles coustani]XP_058176415.1 uncharacterized protein LOC131291246 [Anopheles ziemanni]
MPENTVVAPPRHHHSSVALPPAILPVPSGENHSPPLSVIKFLELCLAVACTTLHYYSFDDGDLVTGFLATGTFCGFIVILSTIMAGYLIKAHLHRRLAIFYSLLGSACFLTSGVFIIEAWKHAFRTRMRDLAITKGSIAIINGVIFLMDTIFTFRERK